MGYGSSLVTPPPEMIFFFEKRNGHVLGENSLALWQRLSLDLITGPLSTKQVLYIAACTCIVRIVGKCPARPSSHWQEKIER